MPQSSAPADRLYFGFKPGRELGGKYVIEGLLGRGWEGEVYRVVENRTGALRAAKVFFPQRNNNDRAVNFYAKKLERLRSCPIVIKYHHAETIHRRDEPVTVLISEYVEGEILDDLIRRGRGKRLPDYEALRIFYELVVGLESIHAEREYHGDLHTGNLLVQRRGVHFDVKLVDLFDHGRPSKANAQFDLMCSIRLLYDMLGGQKRYSALRPELKWIMGGLRQSLVLKRFPTAAKLRTHLERFEWQR